MHFGLNDTSMEGSGRFFVGWRRTENRFRIGDSMKKKEAVAIIRVRQLKRRITGQRR
jgi:hypothetical protein